MLPFAGIQGNAPPPPAGSAHSNVDANHNASVGVPPMQMLWPFNVPPQYYNHVDAPLVANSSQQQSTLAQANQAFSLAMSSATTGAQQFARLEDLTRQNLEANRRMTAALADLAASQSHAAALSRVESSRSGTGLPSGSSGMKRAAESASALLPDGVTPIPSKQVFTTAEAAKRHKAKVAQQKVSILIPPALARLAGNNAGRTQWEEHSMLNETLDAIKPKYTFHYIDEQDKNINVKFDSAQSLETLVAGDTHFSTALEAAKADPTTKGTIDSLQALWTEIIKRLNFMMSFQMHTYAAVATVAAGLKRGYLVDRSQEEEDFEWKDLDTAAAVALLMEASGDMTYAANLNLDCNQVVRDHILHTLTRTNVFKPAARNALDPMVKKKKSAASSSSLPLVSPQQAAAAADEVDAHNALSATLTGRNTDTTVSRDRGHDQGSPRSGHRRHPDPVDRGIDQSHRSDEVDPGVNNDGDETKYERSEDGECEEAEPCSFFFSPSGCRFGDRCHYSHFDPQESYEYEDETYEYDEEDYNNDYNEVDEQDYPYPLEACRWFQTHGTCRFGSRCKFSHDVPDDKE
jgi:hypothetical protein